MRYTLLIVLATCLQITFGQNGSVSGMIKTTKGVGLEFTSISLRGTTHNTLTDKAGAFKLEGIPFGKYKLEVTLLGYEPQISNITLNADQPAISISKVLREAATSLDAMVVSGTMKPISRLESPVPVEVYSPAFFAANPTPSVFESMQNINGVRPQLNCNVCNTGDIHINGLEGPYTMVLIDGMPIVSGLSTVYGLTGIPQSLIDRVEIVKGPASTLYGSEAVGGLINVITKKPVNAPVFSFDMMTSSWMEVNTDLGVKYRLGKKVNALAGLNYFFYDNPLDNNNDGFTDVTLQDRISIFNKFSFERKDNRIFSLAGRYVYEDRWGGEMSWRNEHRGGTEVYGESIYTSRWETFGIYQLPTKEHINLMFSANGHQQNSVYGDTWYIADQYVGFGQLVWSKELKHHDLLIGATYRYTWYDDNTPATQSFDSINPTNMPSITELPGLFVQDEWKLNDQHSLLLGMRYDRNSVHGDIFTPRINYKASTKDKLGALRISAGNGYRVANVFTEDHAALTGARQVEFIENLLPEQSWNGNVNIVKKFITKGGAYLGLDVTGWYTYFTNKIIPDYETDPNKIIYSNLDGHSVSQGASINLDIAFENGLKLLTGATVMDVYAVESNVKARQLLTEQATGVWNASYEFAKHRIKIDYTGNLYGPMKLPLLGDTDDRPEFSPWFSIQNIQITKSWMNGLQFYGGVKNLLNYTPPNNSIARAFDPFDSQVVFNNAGEVVATPNNPNALTFDPSYVFAPNQGIRGFIGLRYSLK